GTGVFRMAGHFLRRRELVEEAAQEAFLNAFSQLASFEGRGSFEGWISRIATNVCINAIRRSKSKPESLISELTDDETAWFERSAPAAEASRPGSVESHLVAADLADKVLATLSPADRLVLMLTEGEELSIKETAEMTGWSQSKVKVQAMRARRRFRQAVEKLLARTTEALSG